MKLLYITNQICGSGGLERVLSIKASYLADKLNYGVHIITLHQGDIPLFYNFSDNLHYHDIKTNNKNPLTYLYRLRQKVNDIAPDVISVCDDGLKGFFLPILLGRPCPMIYERHASKNIFKTNDNPNVFDKIKHCILNNLMNFGASTYDSFVVLTNDNLNEWKLKNITVIANPLSVFSAIKSNLQNKKVIVVGSHNFQKGFDRLLTIWVNIAQNHPEWSLDIYGKIDKDETYIKLANKLNLNKSVRFHPPVKNIEEKYNEASIFLLTSRSEGFGMVLIEAMSIGLPCISFECPSGPKDIISNGSDGFLIPNGDLDAFSKQLELLINNKDLRLKMGKNAVLKSQTYLPETIVPQWDTLFKNLTNFS